MEEEIGLFVITCANFKILLEEEIGLFVITCANFMEEEIGLFVITLPISWKKK
jgi:hypothetical protein